MEQNKHKFLEFSGSMLLSVFLFLIIYRFIPIVYSTNDDRMIAEIVSGQFTGRPESYGIQMTYGFTWFLSRLYLITRSFDWYGIVLLGIQIFAFGAVLYRLQSFFEKWQQKLLVLMGCAGIYMALWLKVYVQMTYTTTAAFVGFAAIFWYSTSKTDRKNICMVGVLANLAFSIRPNLFYMLLPATGTIYLWKLIGRKDTAKLTVIAPFMILAVTLGLFAVDAAAYSKDGWKEFKEFFDARTKIYDYYGWEPYEEHPELYKPYGISEEEYNLMKVYDYAVLGDLPKEFFPEYIEAYQEMEKAEGITPVTKAANAVKTFCRDVVSNAYGLCNSILFAIAAILLVILFWKKEYPLAVYLLLQCLVNMLLWLYFTYWGRAIDRIQVSMSLIFLAVLVHMFYELKDIHIFGNGRWIKGAKILFLVGILLFAGRSFLFYRYDNIYKSNQYTDVQLIKEFCAQNPENLYYMDIATMTGLYGKVTIRNTEPDYANYILLGDWSAYCPHYEKKLADHGVEDVADTLTEENTYVVILHNYQLKCMKEYLGEAVTQHWADTVFGVNGDLYAVYEFNK